MLSPENLEELVERAKVPEGDLVLGSRRAPRRDWFAGAVKATVRGWLARAGEPPVSEVAEELRELKQRLHDGIGGDPERIVAAVRKYRQLSRRACQEIDRHGAIKDVPSPELIESGDRMALHRLYGLIPVRPASLDTPGRLFGDDADFVGGRAAELSVRNRPPDVRLEQLAHQLIPIYWLATGRLASRSAANPFLGFFYRLVGLLLEQDSDGRGERALRRALQWHKAEYRKRFKS